MLTDVERDFYNGLKEDESTDSRLKWPTSYLDPAEYAGQLAQAGEEALSVVEKVKADPDLTEEARARKVAEAEAAFAAKEKEINGSWEQRFAAWEADATLQAKPPKSKQSEVYLLAQSNGLAMLNLMAGSATVKDLQKEFEAVVARDLPGEVEVWAKTLPGIAREKAKPKGFVSEESVLASRIEARCAEVLEAQKTDKQRRGEQNLQLAKQRRQELQSIKGYLGMFDQGGNLQGGLTGKVRHLRAHTKK